MNLSKYKTNEFRNKAALSTAIIVMCGIAGYYFITQIRSISNILFEINLINNNFKNAIYESLVNNTIIVERLIILCIYIEIALVGLFILAILVITIPTIYSWIKPTYRLLARVFTITLIINGIFLVDAIVSPGYYVLQSDEEMTVEIPISIGNFGYNPEDLYNSSVLAVYKDHNGQNYRTFYRKNIVLGTQNAVIREQRVKVWYNEKTGTYSNETFVLKDKLALDSERYPRLDEGEKVMKQLYDMQVQGIKDGTYDPNWDQKYEKDDSEFYLGLSGFATVLLIFGLAMLISKE